MDTESGESARAAAAAAAFQSGFNDKRRIREK